VELISGVPYIGTKADIWSMGVILYYLATGTLPFKGNTMQGLYRNIKTINYRVPPNIDQSNFD
jgi:serine/threonine protein kinase